MKNYKIYFTSVFVLADILFYSFLELHSTLSEKYFCCNFPFLTDPPKSKPLNGQNLLLFCVKICYANCRMGWGGVEKEVNKMQQGENYQ